MWRSLTEARLSYQKPERRYFESDRKKQRAWLEEELPKINETVRKYRAILYFEDESCIRLTPVLGKTWSPIGKTPIQRVTGNRGSVAAISAISASGHLIFNLHRDKIRSDEIIRFLDQMLKHHARRHLVVVMDQAKPHTSKKVKAYIATQKRLHVYYLPSRSPEFNPDEKVWNHLKNEELKAHQARTLAELEKLTRSKLCRMSKNPNLLLGLFFRCFVAKLLN
jgi:transposase